MELHVETEGHVIGKEVGRGYVWKIWKSNQEGWSGTEPITFQI